MNRIYRTEDLMTALFAALAKNGGTLELTFEELGEAAITEQGGDAAIAVERTASGMRYAVVESPSARVRRGGVFRG